MKKEYSGVKYENQGASCSKLTTSVVNDSLKGLGDLRPDFGLMCW